MAFTGVPLMIGTGFDETPAVHPADSMRQLIADFVRGSEGVMRDTDLRVLAQPAPDGTVRIGPGGVVVLNRALGGDREAYYDYNDEDVTVPISGTGSSGGRSDLIVAQVEDPRAAGTRYPIPANPARGPYTNPRVIPNVAKTIYTAHQLNQGRSCVTLARIDQPVNNRVITQAMIKDMRPIANGPQRYQEPDPPPDPPPPILGENPWTESKIQPVTQTLNYTDRSFIDWPSGASWRVPVPKDCNGVDIFLVVENPQQWDHHIWGEMTVSIGDLWGTPSPFDMDAIPVPSVWPGCKPSPFFTGISTRPNRIPLFYSTTFAFTGDSRAYKGTLQTVKAHTRMYNDANTRGRLVADTQTVCYVSLNFKTKPQIN